MSAVNCQDCGNVLTAEEVRYLEHTCNTCESIASGLMDAGERTDELAQLRTDLAASNTRVAELERTLLAEKSERADDAHYHEAEIKATNARVAELEAIINTPGDDTDRMVRIDGMIARLQEIQKRFGNTCVYVRRGGMSWGAVALNREADDKKHGVFDLQAQHDRDMTERVKQVERLIADRNHWREAQWESEKAIAAANTRLARLSAVIEAMDAALSDLLAGWVYIRTHHGDLYGVGWDRAQEAGERARAAKAAMEGESE